MNKSSIELSDKHPLAVYVSDVYLGFKDKFSFKNEDCNILKGVNMNIAPSSIYGLLGPSGCGKTTLLKCIVGFLEPIRGEIKVFGNKLHDNNNLSIPGIDVGYMPQESEIYNELTIEEILLYFGRIGQMDIGSISKSICHLIDILELPGPKRLISSLSGGQKRRVSFAISIIHKPILIVLDEPTAGADPIVRQKIWLHLKRLSQERNTAIIVTTHYIEEAIVANKVGLMRKGRILKEDEPLKLLELYQTNTLENVFLRVCNLNKTKTLNRIENSTNDLDSSSLPLSSTSQLYPASSSFSKDNHNLKIQNIILYEPIYRKDVFGFKNFSRQNLASWITILLTITWKNYIRNFRNPLFMVFQFIVPILPIVLFCFCFGSAPFHIPIGIINEEKSLKFSEIFINNIDKYYFTPIHYKSMNSALKDAKETKLWGVLRIKANFTEAINKRSRFDNRNLTNEIIKISTIDLHVDFTNRLINIYLQRSLDESYLKFVQSIYNQLNISKSLTILPIKLDKPIYGERKLKRYDGYREYAIPAMIVMVCFSMATSLTALVITLERTDNMLDRHYITGISITQFLGAHLINRLSISFVQVSIILIITVNIFKIFDAPSFASSFSAFILLMSQTLSGMSLGMVITSLTRDKTALVVVTVSVTFFIIFTSGTLWPIEGMMISLRWFCYLLPNTIPAEGLRSIFSRGFVLSDYIVIKSLIVTYAWFIIFFSIGIRQFKFT